MVGSVAGMKVGDPLPTVERRVTQERIERYAEASGDFNPVHVDPEFAAASRFGTTIAHGMMVAATLAEAMTKAFRMDWLEGGRLKIRFRAPVFPGDTVSTFGKVESIHERSGRTEAVCSVEVRRQNGEAAITGEASVSIPTGTSP